MSKFTLKWGILATGGIAETFATDLTAPPESRGVKGIEHTVVAAASSSSASRAQDFLKKVGAPSDAKAYGSYEELVEDANVDVIYIATPHSHHYQNARLCLEAGKNVLCEKALTVNAKQTKILIDIARSKDLFFMEAVWTRYFPLSVYVREQLSSGRIGTVRRATADVAIGVDPAEAFPESHRMVNPALAGGALLDLGIYSLTWVFQCLYTTQDPATRKPPRTLAAITKFPATGVDEATSILLTFPRSEGEAHGVATTGFRTTPDSDGKGTVGPAVRVYGDKGELQVWWPCWRPQRTRIVLRDGTVEEKDFSIPGPGQGSGWYNGFGGGKNPEGEGQGMFWEADEVAFALRDGRKEGQYETLEESLTIMEVMDEVRRQNDLVYPEQIESTEYPLKL